jgi:4-hydroxybenzoate polyprenyltransferase
MANNKILHNMTMTGVALFALGLITMIPEIYFSGIIVTALSLLVEIKDLDKKRLEAQGLSEPGLDANETYYSW